VNKTQDTLEPVVHANRDPITGEPGSHPVGTGLGSAGGAAAGAAVGAAVGGPVGAMVGGVAGAVAGGAAGHAAGEALDPTVEIAYWRSVYVTRPYYRKDRKFDDLEPAYRYGWERAADSKAEQRFEEVESELERTWPTARGNSPYAWQEVRDAARDSWTRVRGQ
jgi:phage tail tape-measure protein